MMEFYAKTVNGWVLNIFTLRFFIHEFPDVFRGHRNIKLA